MRIHWKKMICLLLVLLSVLALAACGSEDVEETRGSQTPAPCAYRHRRDHRRPGRRSYCTDTAAYHGTAGEQ